MNTTQSQNSTAMQFAANLTLGMMADVCEHTLHVLSHEQLKNRVRDLRQDAERALAGMNEAKASTATAGGHTPGPWTTIVRQNVGTPFCDIFVSAEYAPDGDVCRISHQDAQNDGQRDGQTEFANARLIAQAPAMLEALKNAIAWADSVPAPYREWGFIKQARAILAAVEGKQ